MYSMGFSDGQTGTFPAARTSCCVGGTHPTVSSMMGVGDAGPNLVSIVVQVLNIEITMKFLQFLKL